MQARVLFEEEETAAMRRDRETSQKRGVRAIFSS